MRAWAVALAMVLGLWASPTRAQLSTVPPDSSEPIRIIAQEGSRFTQGAYEVWILRGACAIDQGTRHARSREAVIWIHRLGDHLDERNKVIAYFEGNVTIDEGPPGAHMRIVEQSWLERFHSTEPIDLRVARVDPEPQVKPAVFQRAMAHREPDREPLVQQAQFAPFDGGLVQSDPIPPGTRRLRVFPRGDVPPQVQVFRNTVGNEWVAVIESGVNLIIDGVEGFGAIDVSTDRMIIWTTGLNELDLNNQTVQSRDTPLEIYMEGNIVFRQGERVIYADRVYYDARNEVGTVVNAEVLTPVPDYQGLLRLRADVLKQISRDRFVAEGASITSSRLARPRYRLQAESVYFEDIQRPIIDPFSGAPLVNPETGEPLVEHERLATSRNNLLFLGPAPVFYWPTMSTNLEEPTFYLRGFRFGNDQVFGTQVLTDWNAFELLGIQNPPEGTRWDVSLDYLSKRGLGGGTTVIYDRTNFWDFEAPHYGWFDFWGIKDHGLDNLGLTRMNLLPEPDVSFRHRLMWRHRHYLPNDFQLTVQTSWISDRNFLEQYFEAEWDQYKNPDTGIELKRLDENRSASVRFDYRINDFFTETEWFPRGDHFWLGQSLLGDRLTWFEHSSIGYGRLRVLSPPTDPQELVNFAPLPWEVSGKGLVAKTRQEIDWPFLAGPFNVVPYALGELAYWGQDLNLDSTERAFGQLGVRTSLPMWAVNPYVENSLFNLHGLAHKVTYEAEFSYGRTNRPLTDFQLYDPVDDFSIEQWRRRFRFITFGGNAPIQVDERFYAFRTGMQNWVTAASSEIVDDLTALRFGVNQRWQTKRGMPGRQRIVDWITLDTQAVWFPDPNRDNFGADFGLMGYDFRWHVGDRTTVVSDAMFDTFDFGQRVATIGTFLNRPPRGNVYLGFRMLQGPINSKVLSTSYSYRMSPKWASTFSTSFDVRAQNIGQYFALTRIGESFLVSAGFNVDHSKQNVGVNFAIEPRFLPGSRLGMVGAAPVPVAGVHGLE